MSDASKIDDGGAAFPCTYLDKPMFDALRTEIGTLPAKAAATVTAPGLTKRDYFAAAALPAVIAMICEGHLVAKGDARSNETLIARQALAFADALIAASKSSEPGHE